MKQTIVVVGGGIAGVSSAAHLAEAAPDATVVLVEAEPQLAHHTTGRSAAILIPNYGAGSTLALTRSSLDFLRDVPADLADHPLLEGRDILTVGLDGQDAELQAMLDKGRDSGLEVNEIDVPSALAMAPHIRPEVVRRAIVETGSADIDVAGLHQAFVRMARRSGASINVEMALTAARADGAGWAIETTSGPLHADVIVNCAGAWGDVVAARCGLPPIGLRPLRRTAFMVRSPFDGSAHWPLVDDASMQWYVKPDGSQFLCSPADESPDQPRDAKPEAIDVAMAIDRINAVTLLDIRSVASSWAGLRTFSPDRSMVIGPDPEVTNFIWCVGQGGTGIQTSPGAGRLVADLVVTGQPGPRFDGLGLDLDALLPDRLR